MPRWPAVQHLSFPVRDTRRAAAFYRDALGFDELHVSDEVAELTMGETKLVLLRGVPDPRSSAHFGFREDSRGDVDRWASRVVAAGARIGSGPAVAPWGGYALYFRDPDGYQIEIWSDR